MQKVFIVCATLSASSLPGQAVMLLQEESASEAYVNRLVNVIENTAEQWKEENLRTGQPLTTDPRQKLREEVDSTDTK